MGLDASQFAVALRDAYAPNKITHMFVKVPIGATLLIMRRLGGFDGLVSAKERGRLKRARSIINRAMRERRETLVSDSVMRHLVKVSRAQPETLHAVRY